MTRWEVTMTWALPKPLPSGANLREHWATKARRVKCQRMVAALHCRTQGAAFFREWAVMRANEALRLECTLTRVAPRRLDDDNLAHAFKAIRDEVALSAGIDDGSPRWVWRYGQESGDAAVRVRLVVMQRNEEATFD